MLVPMKEILDAAYAGKYGVPAVPSFNEVFVRASLEAASESKSPIIFLTSNRGDAYWSHDVVKYFANQVNVPVALCLDHSRTYEDCIVGIRTGCTAIMADRSTLLFDENVAQLLELAKVAHAAGVSIEGELGHVGQGSNYAVDGVSALTDPAEAKKYVELTGVDALAVAIGTAHGAYTGVPKLDFERLADINKACGIPLVLHGGSGSGDDNISRTCTMGVAKVNIVTDFLQAINTALKAGDFSGNNGHQIFMTISKAIKETSLRVFDITGCTGKAAGKAGGSKVGNDEESTQEK
ncbi:MAG: class II fructose-bisphosphate aldolase [Treponema sp.]|nr:class II fructose-bisphosphate aldolase [Treponema sp.]